MIKFNLDALKPWDKKNEEFFPKFPFIAVHEIDQKKLIYLASTHGSKKVSPKKFELIDFAFNTYKPNVVIVESPQKTVDLFLKDEQKLADRKDESEGIFTMYRALNSKIQIFGGDYPNENVTAHFLEKGYVPKELSFFYMIRYLYQFIRNKDILTEADFDRFWKQNLEHLLSWNHLTLSSKPTVDEFKSFWEEKTKKPFSVNTICSMDLGPIQNGTFFNQCSSEISKKRDTQIISVIEKALTEFNTVFIVCGGSHYTTQSPVFKQALPLKNYIDELN